MASQERAHHITEFLRKCKLCLRLEAESYSDKVAVVTFVVSSIFKILHHYKIDDELYRTAQDELLTAVSGMNSEASIDATYKLTLHYVDLLTKALRKWLQY